MTLLNGPFAERYANSLANRPASEWETVFDHLEKVADSASTFAYAFHARPWGEVLGRCHDLGRLSDAFQLYLQNNAGIASADAGVENDDPRWGGYAERDAALLMLKEKQDGRSRRITVGADKAYDTKDFVSTARELNVTVHVTKNDKGGAATWIAEPRGTPVMPSA